MKSCKKALLFLFAIMLTLSFVYFPTAAKAQADLTPPTLISFALEKGTYSSGEKVTVTVTAKDESGLAKDWPYLETYNVNEEENSRVFLRYSNDVTTDTQKAAGISAYKYTAPVNDSYKTGKYYIYSINLSDECSNSIRYRTDSNAEHKIKKVYFNVTNTVRTDFKGPVVTSLTCDKKKINAGESVTFTMKANDPSGLFQSQISFFNPRGELVQQSANLHPVDDTTLKGDFTTDATAPDGDYELDGYYVMDNLGNYTRGNADITFTVNNPAYKNAKPPRILNVSYADSKVKAGDKVRISVTINPNGTYLTDTCWVRLKSAYTYTEPIDLYRNGNTYTGEAAIPPNLPAAAYTPEVFLFDSQGTKVNCEPTGYVFPSIQFESIFSGVENVSVPIGSNFDVKAGVTAQNTTEGDITGKIEVSGNIDTKKTGIYLLHYKIKSAQKDGYGNPLYYHESRFVGVTEVMPDSANPDAQLAVTDEALKVGAASSDVSVERDGKSVSYAGSYTTAGKYTVTEKSPVATAAAGNATLYLKSASAAIDKTGPVLSLKLSGTASSIKADVAAKDPSGVKVLKYLSGTQTAAKVKANGKDIQKARSFTAGANGKYTVYAEDGFGHASIKTFDVKFVKVSGMKFTAKSTGVLTGKSYKTTLSFSPANATNKSVEYTSGNNSIATVDAKGVVKAIKPGTVSITATALDGSGKKAAIKITVKNFVAVTKISLSKSALSLGKGKSFTLGASVSPNNATVKSVKWQSANTKIATVDANGKVHARSKGKVVITATAKDGSGKKAFCTVTVK